MAFINTTKILYEVSKSVQIEPELLAQVHEELFKEILHELTEGNTVELGTLGNLRPIPSRPIRHHDINSSTVVDTNARPTIRIEVHSGIRDLLLTYENLHDRRKAT